MNYDIIKRELLSAPKILALTLQLFYQKWKYVLGVFAVFYVPFYIMTALFPQDMSEKITDFNFMLKSSEATHYIKFAYIFIGLYIFFTSLLAGGLSYITAQTLNNKKLILMDIISYTLNRWWKLLLTYSIYFIMICFTTILIIPAIYLGIVFILATSISAISNKYGISAFKISYALIKGNWFKALHLFILSFILSSLIKLSLTQVLEIIGMYSNVVVATISSIITGFLTCFPYIALCMFYFNIQVNQKSKEQN